MKESFTDKACRAEARPARRDWGEGGEQDVESNLYYFGARIYDPAGARWLSVDPLAGKYPSLSSYNYSLNDPINYFDPDGRDVGFTSGAQNNKSFNKSKNLMLKTQLGSTIFNSLKNNKSILVIFRVAKMDTYHGTTQYISSKKGNYLVDNESFNNEDGKKIVVVSINSDSQEDNTTVEGSETIFHELEAHVNDYASQPPVLDSEQEDHAEYGRTGKEKPKKDSIAEEYLKQAEEAYEDQ